MALFKDRISSFLNQRVYVEFDIIVPSNNSAETITAVLSEIGDDYIVIGDSSNKKIINLAHVISIGRVIDVSVE